LFSIWRGRGILVILGGIALALAVRQMVRAKTAVDVRKPTTEIVTSGVFQFSRNPIYLSMVVLCLGAAFLLDSLWFLALCAPLAIVLQRAVIEPEEAYLEQKFGAKYLRYKAKVRRWLCAPPRRRKRPRKPKWTRRVSLC